jgi:hypothetical protein
MTNLPPDQPQQPGQPDYNQGQNPPQYNQGQPYPQQGYPQQGYYQGPPPKKSHTVRNVLLGIVLLFVLLIGGCFALVGTAANEVGKSIDKSIAEEEANDKPTDVTLGTAFTHDGYEVADGWTLEKDEFGDSATIKNINVTNTKEDEYSSSGGRTALLTFRLYQGKNNLAEITCNGKELQVGESGSMDCYSTDDLPAKYNAIRVADLF